MTFPSDNFGGVPPQYQGNLTFVPSAAYQGGGYYAAYARGAKFSFAQMEGLWDSAGGDPKLAPLMAAIGENESGGYTGAWNSTGATSLWQIEYPGSTPPGVTREQLFNPMTNAKAAVKLSGNTLSGIESNWAGDPALNQKLPHIPPTNNFPPGTGNTGAPGPAPSPIPFFGAFANFFSNPVDALERLGLILFGGVILLVGVSLVAFTPARKGLETIGGIKHDRGSPALSPEDRADRERRMQLAERSSAIGERRVKVTEAREERIGRVARIHGGRTKGREPNPEPIHE